jgi:hypothetical protein
LISSLYVVVVVVVAPQYWKPIVMFLLQKEVAEHFKPSATLLALTMTMNWL